MKPKSWKYQELVCPQKFLELHNVNFVATPNPGYFYWSCVIGKEYLVPVSKLEQKPENVKFWDDLIAILIKHTKHKRDNLFSVEKTKYNQCAKELNERDPLELLFVDEIVKAGYVRRYHWVDCLLQAGQQLIESNIAA